MANYNILTLSEPVTDFVATTSPATINLQCGLMEDTQRKKVYAVYKAGGMPAHPYDGVRVLMTGDPLVTVVISGLTNDTEYGMRLFVEGAYGYQTALEGATARATPRAGQPISALPVGTIVKLIEGGTPTDYIIVHQGLPSSIYDASCEGTWLLRKEIFENRQWHSSKVNDWANSTLKAYLDSTFLGRFDANIQNAIKQVKIPYRPGSGTSGTVNSGANGLSCKVFLLSGYEVGTVTTSQNLPPDGACLSYFAGTAATDAKRIAYLSGKAVTWWLRSPSTLNALNAWSVILNGSCDYIGCSNSTGVRPACVLPSDLLVSSTPNPDGSFNPIL